MSSHSGSHVGKGADEKDIGIPTYTPDTAAITPANYDGPKRDDRWLTRNGLSLDSFKRRENGEGIAELDRSMKPRHLNMIAIGGSIGAGFFVGSGKALSDGGPGALLIDFIIIGVMMFNVVFALGELAVMFPVSGGFYTYAVRFIDPSWGFAMGWNYVLQWAIVVPLELTVVSIAITYWDDQTSQAVWISVFLVAILIINIFGTLGYAEEEFWSSCLKLSATVIFIIIAFVCVLGGGPSNGRYNEYWGDRLWHDPGPWKNGFRGFCSVFVTAAFSFSGTELVGLAAAEAKNPVKALPSAIKQVFWRITLFYVIGLLFIGLLIRSDDENLTRGGSNDPRTSPFVLVAKYAGLDGFDHFMNTVIMISVVSIGVSGVYGGSRCLTALSQQGYAPKVFSYVDRSGRPLYSVLFCLFWGVLAYINLNSTGATVFNWLVSLSGMAALFTWGSICFSHIRFRAAWAYHGHSVDEIPFRAVFGVYGSWVGFLLCVLVLIAQFYVALCPPGEPGFNNAEGFFESYLSFPIVIAFWVVGYFWKRAGWQKVSQIDVDSGRRELDWDEINAFRAQLAAAPAWKRVLHKLF